MMEEVEATSKLEHAAGQQRSLAIMSFQETISKHYLFAGSKLDGCLRQVGGFSLRLLPKLLFWLLNRVKSFVSDILHCFTIC